MITRDSWLTFDKTKANPENNTAISIISYYLYYIKLNYNKYISSATNFEKLEYFKNAEHLYKISRQHFQILIDLLKRNDGLVFQQVFQILIMFNSSVFLSKFPKLWCLSLEKNHFISVLLTDNCLKSKDNLSYYCILIRYHIIPYKYILDVFLKVISNKI